MKILSPSEIKQASESERTKDIARIESTRQALNKVQQQLAEAEAKFELALASQNTRFARAEEEAHKRLEVLEKEIIEAEKRKVAALIPIEREKEIAHNLFIQAENSLREVEEKKALLEKKEESLNESQELLAKRLDEASEDKESLRLREERIILQEAAIYEQREEIKKLSQELSIKLTQL